MDREAGSHCPACTTTHSSRAEAVRLPVSSSGSCCSPEFWRCLAKTHCIGSARSPISFRLTTRLNLALPEGFWGVREITVISLDRIRRTVRTSSHQLRVNGLRGIKEPELPRLSSQAKPIHAIKSVINYTGIFKSPEAGGSVSPLNCNTSPAVAVQWVWVVFTSLRRSSAWWFLSTADNSASAVENKTCPSFLALSSVAWMCRRPDNSRTPAAQRREHFPRIRPNPSDITPIKKKTYVRIRYSPSVFSCANPTQGSVYAHLTRCCKR